MFQPLADRNGKYLLCILNMRIFKILLSLSWRCWLNRIRYGADQRRKGLIHLLGLVVFLTALYLIGRSVLGQVTDDQVPIVLKIVSVFMTFGALVVVKDVMEGSLKRLYEAAEISHLLSLPLSPSTIFGVKLAELIASNLLSMFVWLMPPWIAFGQLFNLPWHFYCALLPTCLCFHLIVVSQATVGMMLIVRFFSSGLLIRAIKFLCVLLGICAGFLLVMSLLLVDEPDRLIQLLLTGIRIPMPDWSPQLWVVNLMMAWLPGADIVRWQWVCKLVVAAIGTPLVAFFLASRFYVQSWERAKCVEVRRKRKLTTRPWLSALGRGKIRSMMRKDFWVFIRHRGRFSMAIMLTLILLVTLISSAYEVRGINLDGQNGQVALFRLAIQAIFYSIIVTLGLTWGGFKTETKTWWLLRSSPISSDVIFHSRLLIALVCTAFYAEIWVLLGVILFQVPMHLWMPVLCGTFLITATVTSLNTAIGTLPWIAGIETRNSLLRAESVIRIATMIAGMMLNGILVIAPAVALTDIAVQDLSVGILPRILPIMTPLVVGASTILSLVLVAGASYVIGSRNLKKIYSVKPLKENRCA